MDATNELAALVLTWRNFVGEASQAEEAQSLAYDLGSRAARSKHGEDACAAAHIQHRCTLDQGGVALERPLICICSHLLMDTPI